MRILKIIAAIAAAPVSAMACPDWSQTGAEYAFTGQQLYTPQAIRVVAGGDQDLSRCALGKLGKVTGFVTRQPDFDVYLQGLGQFSIEFRIVSACDSVLLINTGNENWFYDDDDNGNGDAKIRLTRPSEGNYDVWIGTFDGATCDAELIIETF